MSFFPGWTGCFRNIGWKTRKMLPGRYGKYCREGRLEDKGNTAGKDWLENTDNSIRRTDRKIQI